jgi:Tol biopolymer transport system component
MPRPTLDPSILQGVSILYACSPDFHSEAPEAAELWQIRADGTRRQKLFATEELSGEWNTWLGSLQLSHDGQLLAFIQYVKTREINADASSLWVMNVDGSNPRELVGAYKQQPGSSNWSPEDDMAFWKKPRPVSPVWAPDDMKLAFVDYLGVGVSEPGKVGVLDVASSQWRQVGEGEVCDWSPDGRSLAIHSGSRYAAVQDLQIVDLEGNTQSAIEMPHYTFLALDWSATTGLILVKAKDLEKPEAPVLAINPRDGSRQVTIERDAGYPQWSPDGERISFASVTDSQWDLYILDPDSGQKQLVMPQVDSSGVWSPDSRLILVQSSAEGNGLYVVSVSEGQTWKVPNLEGDQTRCSSGYTWLFPPNW